MKNYIPDDETILTGWGSAPEFNSPEPESNNWHYAGLFKRNNGSPEQFEALRKSLKRNEMEKIILTKGSKVKVINPGNFYTTHTKYMALGAKKYAYGEDLPKGAEATIVKFTPRGNIINEDAYCVESEGRHYIIGATGIKEVIK